MINLVSLGERVVLLNVDSARLINVVFPAQTREAMYVGFSFLADNISNKKKFNFHIRQYKSQNSNQPIGTVHYIIKRYNRQPMEANAGPDKVINATDSVVLSALPLTEAAVYNWYDNEGNLIYTGQNIMVSPEFDELYKLEVIALSDGVKDYDVVGVDVRQFWINSLSPNPAINNVTVNFEVSSANSAYLMIMNQTFTTSNNYIVNMLQDNLTIDISNYQPGVYTVILICDGIAVDAKQLVIN